MYISLQDLCLIILVLLAICVGIYFIITLKNLNNILKMAEVFLKYHHDDLNKSIQLLPETIKTTRDMTQTIKQQVEEVGTGLSALELSLSETVATINDKADTGLTLIKGVGEVLQVLLDIFKKSKS
ncbi:MAG: hypothetical protein ACOX4H_06680 [Bacillota bacterium]|jgi:uncharacterized protein YoxC|nr:hypothetical protein [Clostridia bacterium]